MNPQTLRVLLAAEGMLRRGDAAADGTEAGAASAVILYDLAVETAGKAALAERPPQTFPGTSAGYVGRPAQLAADPPNARSSLPSVFDGLQASYREAQQDDRAQLPNRQDALDLHDFRNAVQHRGVVPSDTDRDRSRTRANDVFDALLTEFFGAARADLSRAALVGNAAAQGYVQSAEQEAAAANFDPAAGWLLAALETLLDHFRTTALRRRRGQVPRELTNQLNELADIMDERGHRRSARERLSEAEKLLGALGLRTRQLERELELIALGGDVVEARWVEDRFVPPLIFGGNGEPEVHLFNQEQPVDEAEYHRLYDFVIDLAVRGQRGTMG